jgi:glycosyltransferase involved in cell wall biosynthesis
MWSFTGRCVHALDCALFRSGCDDTCLTADEYPVLARALIQEAWLEKAALLGTNENLFGVSPSAWLRDKAESGLWNARKVSVIPNGIPLEGYRAANQSAARRALGIGDDECVVITGGSLTPASKGASILRTALQMLDDLKVTVLTMGGTGFGDQVPNARHLGYVSSEAQKILAYSAADLFIHPSVADNLPNVIMEAFACGTPVLAFRTGGMPEMIRDGVNGWCVWPPTPEVLANALRSVLSDMAKLKELRPGCLAVAANEYDVELQASRYEDLFNSIKPESTYAPELLTAQRGATAG